MALTLMETFASCNNNVLVISFGNLPAKFEQSSDKNEEFTQELACFQILNKNFFKYSTHKHIRRCIKKIVMTIKINTENFFGFH